MNDIKLIENIEHLVSFTFGILILMVAFNVYNPFNGEKELAFIKKYNLLIKLAGAAMILNAVVKLLFV